jgi:glycogen phosphorylase
MTHMHSGILSEDSLRAEIDGFNSPRRQEMKRGQLLTGASGGYRYNAVVSSARPTTDYTPRVIPNFADVAVPLQASQILWQR